MSASEGAAGSAGEAEGVAAGGVAVMDGSGALSGEVVWGAVVWGEVWASAEPAKARAAKVRAVAAARKVFMVVTVLLQRRCVTQGLRWRGNTVEMTSHSGHRAACGTRARPLWRQNGVRGKA